MGLAPRAGDSPREAARERGMEVLT
ncbi:hypothetical protein EI555_003271 [Monodon monoceros]|uniref:Uncharacterized protein n=1 Tax=Monodon monoceros TaxID=40151 RepID=A0A4U1EHQ8_MONMO|nr:hypothetical protein EI555_003271 [Monodon monoceros]